jgi:ligand-binding sensor domain-containing protein/signal transduction histidine kinase
MVEVPVAFRNPKLKLFHRFGDRHRRSRCVILLLLVFFIEIGSRAQSKVSPAVGRSTVDPLPAKVHLVDGSDIRFRRLAPGAGLSQTRAEWVVQDKVGFIWFGTQYGLNRYDGYKSKVFKHEPGRPESLSCVYIRSLFVDHAGRLWVGCDHFLDRFEPATETFTHYRITGTSDELSTPIERMSEDRAGLLWLATERGLYRFDPAIGGTMRLIYTPHNPASIAENRINETGEDREGRFWVAGAGGLEEFDRNTGKVVRRAPLEAEIGRFHEDESGTFWMTQRDPACVLASWSPVTNEVKCHAINYELRGTQAKAAISEILEDRNGTIWFGSTAGLLELDRVHNRILRYHNNPSDVESLESDSIIYLYQDQEENVWTCFQVMEPNFFSERPQPFKNFTYQEGNLLDPLVTSIYEDDDSILTIGSMGGLNRIDRRGGKNIASPNISNEMLAILEDRHGILFGGTFHEGLQRIDRRTGKITPYSPQSTNHHTDPIMRLIYDHEGNLWAAQYGGVGRYDPATGMFTMYTPDAQNTVQYQEIKEDSKGFLWLGAQTGLHRFDPRTKQFKLYRHNTEDAKSLSDGRVNSIHFDRRGTLWVGTQNGLDRFDPASGTFQNYYERDGLAGDVVSCILEDERGVLWMSTNKGLSSFDPEAQSFQNFSAADGLPGRDLTGWGACYQSPTGEMFFGGFGGATAFYPNRIANSSFVPRTVLTDFQLSGNPVPIGGKSPLKQSITRTDSITLSHQQNVFSIEFSALSFFNSATNRYRYKLDGLDSSWHAVGGDQRIASYTTLPASTYTFEVQGATSRGPWSEPGALLRIEILPAWYQTLWFRGICVIAFLGLLWSIYLLRLQELERRFHTTLDARVNERIRIARELHDTLLQSFQGLMLKLCTLTNVLDRPAEARERLEGILEQGQDAIDEGRTAVRGMRSSAVTQNDLARALVEVGERLAGEKTARSPVNFRVVVEGESRDLHPILRDEVYRIVSEAISNAFRHSGAGRITAVIRYDKKQLRALVQDDGKGIDAQVLEGGGREGHYGLLGMHERAKLVGGKLTLRSRLGSGTEIELTIPHA